MRNELRTRPDRTFETGFVARPGGQPRSLRGGPGGAGSTLIVLLLRVNRVHRLYGITADKRGIRLLSDRVVAIPPKWHLAVGPVLHPEGGFLRPEARQWKTHRS